MNILNKVIWFTGLPCSGKTTLAKLLKQKLKKMDLKVIHIDGDEFRKTPFADDLSFSDEDRKKNIARASYLCKMFRDEGYTVLASFVSPTNEIQQLAADIIGHNNIKFVYTKTSKEMCAKRDVKGMWKLAKDGKIKNFTGFDSSYELPLLNNISMSMIDTENCTPEKSIKVFLQMS